MVDVNASLIGFMKNENGSNPPGARQLESLGTARSTDDVRQQPVHHAVDPGAGGFGRVPDDGFGLHIFPLHQFVAAMPQEQRRRFRRSLEVELQPDDVPAELKCLIVARLTLGQAHRPVRQVEGLAVPMERRQPARQLKRLPARIRRLHREPADLPVPAGIHAGAKRAGYELRPETNPDDRLAKPDRLTEERLFRREPRERLLVVDTHRAAHRDDEIGLTRIRQLGRLVKPRVPHGRAPLGQPPLHAADTLKRHMLQHVNLHHGVQQEESRTTSQPAATHPVVMAGLFRYGLPSGSKSRLITNANVIPITVPTKGTTTSSQTSALTNERRAGSRKNASASIRITPTNRRMVCIL